MMKLTDIFRRNQVREPIPTTAALLTLGGGGVVGKYSGEYVWQVVGKIYQGMNNVVFTAEKTELETIAEFLTTNASTLVYLLHTWGYVAIDRDKNGRWFIGDPDRLRLDNSGRVRDWRFVTYSDRYRLTKKTDMETVAPSCRLIDTYKSADDYLVKTFGSVVFLSGSRDLPLTPKERDEFIASAKSRWGLGSDRQQLEVFSDEVKVTQLDLHTERLQLPLRVREEMKAIAGYFGVPYDLIPFSGQSTYANQEQAVRTFYSSCIAPLAETLLDLGREVVKSETMYPTKCLTWHIENVPEVAEDRMAELDYMQRLCEVYGAIPVGADFDQLRDEIKSKLNIITT